MYKVLVIGDIRVGKTSFVHRLVNNLFKDNYKCTLGVDFALKTIEMDDGQSVKLQLWDIADRDSFNNCSKWKKDLDDKVFLSDDGPIPCLLLGNKVDLKEERVVSDQEIKAFQKEYNFIGSVLCSVKENTGLHEGMKFLTSTMVERCNQIQTANDHDIGFSIDSDEPKPSRLCC